MPQLPNSSDVQTKNVNPEINPNMPDGEALAPISRETEAPNFVEKKVDLLPLVTPPTDFVSKKLDQFGEQIYNDKMIDPEFELWLSEQRPLVDPAIKQKEIANKADRFQKMMDELNAENISTAEKTISAPRRALREVGIGALDALNSAGRATIDLANVSRKFLGVQEMENIPDIEETFPEPTDNGERFIRSSAKFIAGMIPVSRALKAATGITGVANTVMSSGAYGFLFEEDKVPGIVNDLVQQNIDLAPDILSYMNHEIDDNAFVTRLKNGAHYATDAVAMEGIFHGLKVARNIVKGKNDAYKVLSNGDVEVKAKEVKEAEKFSFSNVRIKGLTTEDVSKKSTADLLQESLDMAMMDIEGKYLMKQNAVPDRMVQGRIEALKEIRKNPMTLEELLAIPENAPINNLTVMQAEIAAEGLKKYGAGILKAATEGKTDKTIALYKLANIADRMDLLTYPRSTAGRALESAKFISSLDILEGEKDFPVETIQKMTDIFGNDAERIFEETRLSEENLSGFPAVDSVLEATRKSIDPKKIYKYVNTARINWILSDPSIHGANVLANTMTMGVRVATEATARGVTLARGIFGNQYLAKGVQQNEARAIVQGYMQGFGTGINIIGKNIQTAFSKGTQPKEYESIYSKDSNTKYNKAIDEVIEQSNLANNFENATLGKQLVITLGHLVAGTPVGKMLSWEDDFFKGMHYMATVNSELAIKEATMNRLMSQASTPEQAQAIYDARMAEIAAIREDMKNGIVNKAMDVKAKEQANYWTFNNEIAGKDAVSKALFAGEKLVQGFPALKWFVPFYRTGANISNMGLEYTPVIGGIAKMGNVGGVAGLLRGEKEANQFIAKQVIGSGVMATTAIAISKMDEWFGLDFEVGSLKSNKAGIKIGDVEIGVDKQNLVFKLILATRDIMDIANIAEENEGAGRAVQATASLLAEMYSPEQLVQVMGSFSELSNSSKEDVPAKLQNMLKMNLVSQVTPYSGVSKFVNRDIKGMKKVNIGQEQDETLIDEMVKRIKHTYLGDDSNIPTKRGLFGQEIPYLRTFGYQVSDTAHDMFYGSSMADPTIVELMSLTKEEVMSNPQNFDEFELNNTTFLSMPKKTISLPSGEEYKLTPKEYSDYVQFSAGEHPIFKGNTLKKTLDNFITSPSYTQLPSKYRIVAIKKLVNLYRKAAKGILLKDNVDVNMEARNSLLNIQQEFIDAGI